VCARAVLVSLGKSPLLSLIIGAWRHSLGKGRKEEERPKDLDEEASAVSEVLLPSVSHTCVRALGRECC